MSKSIEANRFPETRKMIALQKSIRKRIGFIQDVRSLAEEKGESMETLLSEENMKHTVYRVLGIDPEMVKEENNAMVDFLANHSK